MKNTNLLLLLSLFVTSPLLAAPITACDDLLNVFLDQYGFSKIGAAPGPSYQTLASGDIQFSRKKNPTGSVLMTYGARGRIDIEESPADKTRSSKLHLGLIECKVSMLWEKSPGSDSRAYVTGQQCLNRDPANLAKAGPYLTHVCNDGILGDDFLVKNTGGTTTNTLPENSEKTPAPAAGTR